LAVFFGYLDVTCREFQETAQRDRKHRLFLLLVAFSQIVYATLGLTQYHKYLLHYPVLLGQVMGICREVLYKLNEVLSRILIPATPLLRLSQCIY